MSSGQTGVRLACHNCMVLLETTQYLIQYLSVWDNYAWALRGKNPKNPPKTREVLYSLQRGPDLRFEIRRELRTPRALPVRPLGAVDKGAGNWKLGRFDICKLGNENSRADSHSLYRDLFCLLLLCSSFLHSSPLSRSLLPLHIRQIKDEPGTDKLLKRPYMT